MQLRKLSMLTLLILVLIGIVPLAAQDDPTPMPLTDVAPVTWHDLDGFLPLDAPIPLFDIMDHGQK